MAAWAPPAPAPITLVACTPLWPRLHYLICGQHVTDDVMSIRRIDIRGSCLQRDLQLAFLGQVLHNTVAQQHERFHTLAVKGGKTG